VQLGGRNHGDENGPHGALAKLDSICIFGCTEYRMLKAAMADYKVGKKPTN
jgi:hypothetical protein